MKFKKILSLSLAAALAVCVPLSAAAVVGSGETSSADEISQSVAVMTVTGFDEQHNRYNVTLENVSDSVLYCGENVAVLSKKNGEVTTFEPIFYHDVLRIIEPGETTDLHVSLSNYDNIFEDGDYTISLGVTPDKYGLEEPIYVYAGLSVENNKAVPIKIAIG